MAEGGKCEQRQPRLVAEPACDAGGLDGDLGDLVRLRHLGDRGVGYQHRTSTRHHNGHADHAMARLRIDHVPDIFECDREISRHAGHHGVGITKRDHAGREMVAVLIDHALAVAHQVAVALQSLVQEIDVGGVSVRQPCVDDLDAFGNFDAGLFRGLPHAVLAADEQRRAEPLMHKARRRADHLFLFAFCENDALGVTAQPVEHLHQSPSDRIAPCVQLLPIGIHVDDRLARDTGIHGGLGHCRRHVEIRRGSNGTGMM